MDDLRAELDALKREVRMLRDIHEVRTLHFKYGYYIDMCLYDEAVDLFADDGIVYFLKSNSGILSAYDVKTGKPHYALQRLDGVPNVFASPVGAKGRIYFPGQDGTTLVIKQGPAFEVLAKNALDDGFEASPALVDGELYLRGRKSLYSIGK